MTDETGTECTVHNRIYQLTHLLENGHAIKNQTGKKYGDVPATALLPRLPTKWRASSRRWGAMADLNGRARALRRSRFARHTVG